MESAGSNCSTVLASETKYIAYKLAYLSRTNIQKETYKPDPRLRKLIGHCHLFENAKRVITEHIGEAHQLVNGRETVADDRSDDQGVSSFEYIEHTQDAQSIDLPCRRADSKPAKYLGVDPLCGNSSDDEDDSGTEASDGDSQSDDDWSGSTYEGDDDSDHTDGWLKTVYSISTTEKSIPQDDDLILWSQQPRVLSPMEAEALLVEAFG